MVVLRNSVFGIVVVYRTTNETKTTRFLFLTHTLVAVAPNV
uniref:Uncharacterized protein n=1 Tax=Anguilla anguilla TaxID=7936 RepID=A0A0E9U0A2_ANGAN